MNLSAYETCDVLVIGAGIAGIQAAHAAASAGCRVGLVSRGAICSGSSFYPGTWGLGLIGPENLADEAELTASILAVGRGMADPKLTASFVSGITPAVEALKKMGVQLKEAGEPGEREFIPCFDHKHRAWHGLLFASVRDVFTKALAQGQVVLHPGWELLELTQDGGRIDGAVLAGDRGIVWIRCGAVVLASGGLGGLYRSRLTTDDVSSSAHWLALSAGAELINLEFMQMMPGYLSPCPKTIFNEKTFRWVSLLDSKGQNILGEGPEVQQLLEQRATHGPFTSAFADRDVDLAILRHQQEGGVRVQYRPELSAHMPEFVRTYFDWLAKEKGLKANDSVQIGLFAHASNGGIRIDARGYTGVPGLYAAGEVTGGMHGADRIGGLSTANGLVFGARAGTAAAKDAVSSCRRENITFDAWTVPDMTVRQREMETRMTCHALVLRSGEKLEATLEKIHALRRDAKRQTGGTPGEIARSRRGMAQLGTAQCVLMAQLLRKESRGSHYRADFPKENPNLGRRIGIRMDHDFVKAAYEDSSMEQIALKEEGEKME